MTTYKQNLLIWCGIYAAFFPLAYLAIEVSNSFLLGLVLLLVGANRMLSEVLCSKCSYQVNLPTESEGRFSMPPGPFRNVCPTCQHDLTLP